MSRLRRTASLLAITLGLSAATALPAAQAATDTGPALTVTATQAAQALTCTGAITATSKTPILLLHGTTSNPQADFSWNWDRALDAMSWPHCEVSLPDSGNGDIQVAAEYVVRAIRSMSAAAGGRRIDVVGHSQGGMIGRWALKYWPDTRGMVDDMVGLASSNYGTADFNLICATGFCSAANWQQRRGSAFLNALNDGPDAWPGISYTEIATQYDEIVVPYTGPFLDAGVSTQVLNTTVQKLCPFEVVDHFGMSYSNGAWLIALDALTHPGPAVLSRISRATCGRLLMPGVDPLAFPTNVALALAQTAMSTLTTPQVPAEPKLRSYAG